MPADFVETAKLVTEDAGTVDSGRTELELAYGRGAAEREFDGSGTSQSRPLLVRQDFRFAATHGLGSNLDIGIDVLWADVVVDRADEFVDGFGDVGAVLKWRFYESESGGVALAWLPGIRAPFGPGDASLASPAQDFWSFDNLLVLTLVPGRFNVNLDAGYSLPIAGTRGPGDGQGALDAALGWQWTSWFQPFAELNYSFEGIPQGSSDATFMAITAGGIFNVSEAIRLDAGAFTAVLGRNSEQLNAVLTNLSATF